MLRNYVILCVLLSLPACGAKPFPEPMPPHHNPKGGFQNPYLDAADKSFFGFMRMRFFGNTPWADHQSLAASIEVNDVVLNNIQHGEKNLKQVTWLGHSSFLIQIDGIAVLTDPIFSDRAFPLSFVGPKRYVRHAMDYADLPRIDVVVISHNHYDHLDEKTIKALGNEPMYFVPLGLKPWFTKAGIKEARITELDWQQYSKQRGLKVTALPSQHWSARGLSDRFETLWASWLLEFDNYQIWFAGDTGYNAVQFKDIGRRHPNINLALIPIGAYEPRWFMQSFHVNPVEALDIFTDVGAEKAIGMHWGTFPLTAEPPLAPKEALERALQEKGIHPNVFTTMIIGETRSL